MTLLAENITSNTALYCILAAVDHLLFSSICLLAVTSVFRVSLRKHPLLWLAAGLLSVTVGVSRPFCRNGGAALPLLWETLALLLPFVCVALLVPTRSLLKGLAAALGCCLIDIPKYLILIFCFRYTNDRLDAPEAFLVELLLNIVFFLLFLLLSFRREREKNLFAPLLRLDPVFFVLIVLSLCSFMTSLVLFGSMLSADRLPEFAFMLTNIPLFAATVIYGVSTMIRTKKAEETYRRELDRQILHYETMERINEDLRLFRHDLVKKLRPMVAYLDANDPQAAKEIAYELGAFTQTEGKRFHTGNSRLDTVLFCEQQSADHDGIRIVFTDDSRFPAEGIAPEDIYTIFPNALDNAIEASRLAEGEREIVVTSKTVGDEVFVTVSNPLAGELDLKNGELQTTKKDSRLHGFGIKSIKKAAAKYGSDNVDHIVEDGRFVLRISLRYKNSLTDLS
ncbi:MAG: GHKL domain-containing protein [Clostridia bacterium]|nr:GHKL domain-containing protein [Clostridia bacterium]